MGGEGSGRKPDVVNNMLRQERSNFLPIGDVGESLNIPNYSGIQKAVQNQSGLTSGSVLFAGNDGKITTDSSNLFWDDNNNRLGIGTNAPTTTLNTLNGDITIGDSTNTARFLRVRRNSAEVFSIGTTNNRFTLTMLNSSNNLVIDSSGRVGVGIFNPAAQLEVSGSISVSGGSGVFRINTSPGLAATISGSDLTTKTMTFSGGILIGYA